MKTKYLVAILRPENYDPIVPEDEAMGREIDLLNDEMVAAVKNMPGIFCATEPDDSSMRNEPIQN